MSTALQGLWLTERESVEQHLHIVLPLHVERQVGECGLGLVPTRLQYGLRCNKQQRPHQHDSCDQT